MRSRLVLSVSVVLLLAGVGSAIFVARAANASSGGQQRPAPSARQFVGYWMGIDPLDGGDARRAITRNADGTFSIIGRDTVFTLCDNTDRAVITLDGARIVGSALTGDDLVIDCFNNGSSVHLRARYDIVGRNIIRETTTTQAGDPVDKIIFHLVSTR